MKTPKGLTKRDIEQFNAFLANATDAQVRGIWRKEMDARRFDYAKLAKAEAARRDIDLREPT